MAAATALRDALVVALPGGAVAIRYDTRAVSTVPVPRLGDSLPVLALAGILHGPGLSASYALVVTRAEPVQGTAASRVVEVVAIPLSHDRAVETISKLKRTQLAAPTEDSDSSQEPEDDISASHPILHATLRATRPTRAFWQSAPFVPSKSPLRVPLPARLSSSSSPPSATLADLAFEPTSATVDSPAVTAAKQELDRKIVAQAVHELVGLYYSSTTDLTRSAQSKHERGLQNGSSWRQADSRFFYNRHLSQSLIDAGLDSHVTVLMQGFIASVTCALDDSTSPTPIEVSMTIVSRRSIERAGLRYQRRGIDSSGGVANFVETEFLVQSERAGTPHLDSFVQIRGSVPLFWNQNAPLSLKPPPVLERSAEENLAALSLHFGKLKEVYGKVLVVNLAENTGKEGVLVGAYRSTLEKSTEDVKYHEFDFHRICRGMNYANVSLLLAEIEDTLSEASSFWTTPSQVLSTQTGTVRTNCIDCLDRTNVVQSAIARAMLSKHLVQLGIAPSDTHELDVAFQSIWADNGDSISRAYTSTSALKGDFTRTGQRNIVGQLNDGRNSVARILQNSVFDFWRQAVIDYTLGINLSAIEQFQATLSSSDPAEVQRLSKIRDEAIAIATPLVVVDETVRSSMTVLSPVTRDEIKGTKGGFDEKILLLTDEAVYVISFEYQLMVVVDFVRIALQDVEKLQIGAYVLDVASAADSSGFVIHYRRSARTLERTHSYSIRFRSSASSASLFPAGAVSPHSTTLTELPTSVGTPHLFAFKAIRRDLVRNGDTTELLDEGLTTNERVRAIVQQIQKGCHHGGKEDFVVEQDLISLAEAQQAVTSLELISHAIKRFIWF